MDCILNVFYFSNPIVVNCKERFEGETVDFRTFMKKGMIGGVGRWPRRVILAAGAAGILGFLTLSAPPAQACCDCASIQQQINNHTDGKFGSGGFYNPATGRIEGATAYHGFVLDLWHDEILPALEDMTRQLTKNSQSATAALSALEDAARTNAIETLRQKLKADTEKQFRPSNLVCSIASLGKTLTSARESSESFGNDVGQSLMSREMGYGGTMSEGGAEADKDARWTMYANLFCSPSDENGAVGDLCLNKDDTRTARDINFSAVIGNAKTIKEEDKDALFLMGTYLYGSTPSAYPINPKLLDAEKYPEVVNSYVKQRNAVTAARSISIRSYQSIIGLKGPGGAPATGPMFAVLRDLGYTQEQMDAAMETNPSYYQTLGVLTDYVTRSNQISADIQDTAPNGVRNEAVIQELGTMYNAIIVESQMRVEMLMSAWLELRLRNEQARLENSQFSNSSQGGREAQ